MMLTGMIMVLLVGGLLSWLAGRWSALLSKWIALLAVVADFSLVGYWWFQFRGPAPAGFSWFIDYKTGWIPSFGIGFHVAMDGLSLVLLLLTFFLGILAVLCSWRRSKEENRFLFFQSVMDLGRHQRSVRRNGSVPVLLLLGSDACADVLS